MGLASHRTLQELLTASSDIVLGAVDGPRCCFGIVVLDTITDIALVINDLGININFFRVLSLQFFI